MHNFRVEDTRIELGERRMTIEDASEYVKKFDRGFNESIEKTWKGEFEQADRENAALENKLVRLLDRFQELGNQIITKSPEMKRVLEKDELELTTRTDCQLDIGDNSEFSHKVNFPFLSRKTVDNFSTLTHIVFDFRELEDRDDFLEMMIDTRDHFRLLESLNPYTTRDEVKLAALRLNIEETKAVDWIIKNEWPSLYDLLQSMLGHSYDSSIKVRTKVEVSGPWVEGEYLG